MKRTSLLPGAFVLLAIELLLPLPAVARVRCASYSYNTCHRYVCCHGTCVYCYDEESGEVLSESCSEDCWERTL